MRPFTLFSNTAKEVQKIPSELSGPSNMIDNGSTAAVAHSHPRKSIIFH